MTDEFLQWPPEQHVDALLAGAGRHLLVDDLVRAEAEYERAERAHWARTVEALGRDADTTPGNP